MQIVHIVCSYPPYYGGMGNVALQTVGELKRRGHDVTVLTPLYETLGETQEEDIREERIAARRLVPSISYGNAARLPAIAKELDGADVVHLHYPFFGTAGLVARWKDAHSDVPLCITYHMDTRGNGWKGLAFKWYAAFWMPRILRRADMLVASSFDYIATSDAGGIFQAQKEKWIELPFGVDTDRFQPRKKPDVLFQQYGLDPNIPTVLFVGGMDRPHYFKGISTLLAALLLLKKNETAVQAICVGDGELREGFELKTKGFGLDSFVRFVGSVGDLELPSYYNMADLLVLPSVNRGEAFGMVLLEAMASGIPVAASDLPGVRAVARKGGWTFAPGDSTALAEGIVDFFSGTYDRAALSRDVRRIAEAEYSWTVIVDRLEKEYTRLVRGKEV